MVRNVTVISYRLITPINGISALMKLFSAGKTKKIISKLLIKL